MSRHVDPTSEHAAVAGKPLFVRFLGRIGFENITAVAGARAEPLTAYALLVVFVEVVVLQGFNAVTNRPVAFVENPLWLVRPVVLVGAALATHSLFQRYESAVQESRLLDRAGSPDQLREFVPPALGAIVVAVGVGFTLVNATVLLGIEQLYAAGGPARVFRFLVVTPFGYVPIFGTFLATYLTVEVLVPRRIARAEVNVDFLDPEGLGGMRPVGELLKYAYYCVMVGLVAYALAMYGPHVLGGPFAYDELSAPGAAVNAGFTAVWVVAVGVMAYGIYELHRFMAREKREEVRRLDDLAREQLDEPWDIRQFDAHDPPAEYLTYRERLNLVTATREYPATFTMWSQLLVGVMVPKALQMALSAF
ncbi:hypothetical protein HALDL1_01685 [Halobacterium sp. DL1]|jgi:hypothetical protein|nr:hypothetical protein HALDL1_01685 [Halobacterium sp. DL1]